MTLSEFIKPLYGDKTEFEVDIKEVDDNGKLVKAYDRQDANSTMSYIERGDVLFVKRVDISVTKAKRVLLDVTVTV